MIMYISCVIIFISNIITMTSDKKMARLTASPPHFCNNLFLQTLSLFLRLLYQIPSSLRPYSASIQTKKPHNHLDVGFVCLDLI